MLQIFSFKTHFPESKTVVWAQSEGFFQSFMCLNLILIVSVKKKEIEVDFDIQRQVLGKVLGLGMFC